MKQSNKKKYLDGVACRLAADKENIKWPRCKACGLKVRANGHDAVERMENHCHGFHCRPSNSKVK